MQFDRSIINLGNVTNDDNINSHENDSMLWIEWDAVMIDCNETVNGSTYWVSAGAEYNNSDEVWVGQASFETVTELLVSQHGLSSTVGNYVFSDKINICYGNYQYDKGVVTREVAYTFIIMDAIIIKA